MPIMTNTDTAALTALLQRVEAGEHPGETILALGSQMNIDNGQLAFHGSLDAAKALHEAVTPYPDVDIQYRLFGGLCDVMIYDVAGGQAQGTSTHGIARAWLIAILRALIATPDTEGR